MGILTSFATIALGLVAVLSLFGAAHSFSSEARKKLHDGRREGRGLSWLFRNKNAGGRK